MNESLKKMDIFIIGSMKENKKGAYYEIEKWSPLINKYNIKFKLSKLS